VARHTVLSDGDFAEIAEAFGLGPVSSWSVIEAGTINSNYRFEGPHGVFFLRVNEGKEEGDVAFEAELVASLSAAGIPTPVPRRVAGRPFHAWSGRWVSVFPWVEGVHVVGDAIDTAHLVALGAGLANLHRCADSLELRHRDGIYTFATMCERLDDIRARGDGEIAEVVRDLEDEIEWQRDRRPEHPVVAVVHGDLFPDNVLWRGHEVAAFIDFEQAAHETKSYDLAVCANAWCFTETFDAAKIGALCRSYRAAGGTVEPDELYRELRRSAWRFTITRITDVYFAGSTGAGKDFRRYHRRLSAWRELGAEGLASWLRA